jgi:hypothetical protein
MDAKDKEELKYHCEQIGKLLKKNSQGADKDLYLGEKFLIEQFKETVHPEIGEFFFRKKGKKE